jgi:hypothetical protein
MKRLALVLAVVALGACKKAEQQPAQGQMAEDTSHMMMMSDTSKMMMSDTSKHMAADTAKKMAPKKKT